MMTVRHFNLVTLHCDNVKQTSMPMNVSTMEITNAPKNIIACIPDHPNIAANASLNSVQMCPIFVFLKKL